MARAKSFDDGEAIPAAAAVDRSTNAMEDFMKSIWVLFFQWSDQREKNRSCVGDLRDMTALSGRQVYFKERKGRKASLVHSDIIG